MAEAEVVDLAARRPLSASQATGEEVFNELLRMIAVQPNPAGAALAVIAGFARFAATEGVTADEVTRLVAFHMAAALAEA